MKNIKLILTAMLLLLNFNKSYAGTGMNCPAFQGYICQVNGTVGTLTACYTNETGSSTCECGCQDSDNQLLGSVNVPNDNSACNHWNGYVCNVAGTVGAFQQCTYNEHRSNQHTDSKCECQCQDSSGNNLGLQHAPYHPS